MVQVFHWVLMLLETLAVICKMLVKRERSEELKLSWINTGCVRLKWKLVWDSLKAPTKPTKWLSNNKWWCNSKWWCNKVQLPNKLWIFNRYVGWMVCFEEFWALLFRIKNIESWFPTIICVCWEYYAVQSGSTLNDRVAFRFFLLCGDAEANALTHHHHIPPPRTQHPWNLQSARSSDWANFLCYCEGCGFHFVQGQRMSDPGKKDFSSLFEWSPRPKLWLKFGGLSCFGGLKKDSMMSLRQTLDLLVTLNTCCSSHSSPALADASFFWFCAYFSSDAI